MAGHQHASGPASERAGGRYQQRLLWVFGLTAIFFLVEFIAGILTNSLALLSDAGHMFTDVLGLGMAVAAIQLASREQDNQQRTFGVYRLEILAALANAVLLLAVAIYVLYEAARRLQDPPDVVGLPMLIVAALGFVVNVIAFFLLRGGADESLNVEGAYLEVVADSLGSIGVIVAGIILATTGWGYADPLFGAAIGLFILPRGVRLGRRALHILIQAAPDDIQVDDVRNDLSQIAGVAGVHDLHIWTLTSEMHVLTGHLTADRTVDPYQILSAVRRVLHERYSIDHVTVQIEPRDDLQPEEPEW